MDIPPEFVALAPDLEWMDIDEYAGHIEHWMVMEAPLPDTIEYVEAAVEANPGVWTARLCRAMHGLPETEESIIYCGQCEDYANPRKRARAEYYAGMPTLPGFSPPYQLHPRCGKGLTWLRHRLYAMEHIRRESGSVIPDVRQPRGWDYGTRLYLERRDSPIRDNKSGP